MTDQHDPGLAAGPALSTPQVRLEQIDAAALLGRPEARIDVSAALDAVRGRRVLVTGAGGSVGVPLVERLLELGPAHLVLIDSHEDSLARLQRRLASRRERKTPSQPLLAPGALSSPPELLLCDVRNHGKMANIFRQWDPQVVFHLAAYKHVHFGEAQPDEPISVNVLATHRLVEIAVAHGVEVFVYTSSDKAVNPPGIYGATKRLAELTVRWGAERAQGRFVVTRFVNVLGTRGSVIETFLEQLAAGQPLTITDPAMTRYWMSMREAVDLVLAAAGSGPSGATLVVDPGPAVSVLEMAERLCAQVGEARGRLPVEYVGSRPGERLAEELTTARERLVPGPVAGLVAVERQDRGVPLAAVPDYVAQLEAALARDDAALGPQMMAFARELA